MHFVQKSFTRYILIKYVDFIETHIIEAINKISFNSAVGLNQHHLERRPVHRNVAKWQTSEVVGIKQESKETF